MIRVNFNVAPVAEQLAKAKAGLDDLTPVFQDIGEALVKSTRERFPAGTAPDGTRWRQKQPATLAAYLRRGDGNRPYTLIGPSGRLGKEIAALATARQVEIGSALEYSAVMQFGAAKGAFGTNKAGRPLPWGDIPARPFLGLSDQDERTILDIVDEHLSDALGG